MAELTASTYWDDQTAGTELIEAIDTKMLFYSQVPKSGNHKYGTDKLKSNLSAYDGDDIEGLSNKNHVTPNRNAHAYLTTEDLSVGSVAYSRASLLSAGLTGTEKDWQKIQADFFTTNKTEANG